MDAAPDVATIASFQKARVCYDHLAGELGVHVYESRRQRGFLRVVGRTVNLAESGQEFREGLGIDLPELQAGRRPVCLACLDWSVRRHHLAGGLGAALLSRIFALGWARPRKETRIVIFSAIGERALRSRFTLS